MTTRTRIVGSLIFAWWVVTHSGTPVAGPFSSLSDCREVAELMASQHIGISRICRAQ